MARPDIEATERRITDYRGRHARGEVTTLAHDIALIDAPALLAYIAELEGKIDQKWAEGWLRKIDPTEFHKQYLGDFSGYERDVSKLSRAGQSRDDDNETGINPFAGRRYTWAESKEIPPPGYRYEERDDDPGHPTSRSYWVLVRRVS